MTAPGIPRCRLLCYPPDDLRDGLPLLVASNCFPIKATRFEPAGLSFHLAALSLSGWIFPTEEEDALPSDKKESSFVSPGVDSYFSKGKKKAGVVSEQKDHYSLLGLSHLRYLASEDQIRKAYREVALKFHPDKQASLLLQEETEEAKEAKKEEIDTHFKAIQEAYEVLIDPVKRRIYDSIDEFDDGVPSDCAPEDFFKVFGPVFMRNGRWSVIQPVLVLGDNDTPIEEVDEFYAFWYGFKSWREFLHADEFDLEQAESREHKRWMERQNLKLREKAKKEENVRMRTLVENAYKRDPRIARRKEEEKAEKQRKREAKILAKKEKEEQAAKALEEERLRKVEEEKRLAEEAAIQKKIKEKEKKLIRKERARLRAATSDVIACQSSGVTDEDIDNLCIALDITQLRDLCEKIEKNKGVTEIQCQSLRTVLATLGVGTNPDHSLKSSNQKSDIGLNSSATQQLSNSADGVASRLLVKEEKERPWSKEEVDLLRKAVVKYPKGTSQRWEVISNYIGTGRTVDEILKGVKSVLLQKPDTSKAFDTFLQKRKAPTDIVSPLSTREDGALPENQTLGRAATAVRKDFKAVNTETKLRNDNQGTKTPVVNGDGMEEHHINTVSNGSLTEQDTWSEIQELALVKALKTFPKDTAQRWERIAAAVPGKTKSQCFKKFAELREKFRNKKGAE